MAIKKKVGLILSGAQLKQRYPTANTASSIIVPKDEQLWLPSSILGLNWQYGGGIPYGTILEEFGEESTGKSLLAVNFAIVAQSLGGIVLWNDAEAVFRQQARFYESMGLNLERVELYPDENIIEKISDWQADMIVTWRNKLKNNEPILLVIDSTAALDTWSNMEAADSDSGEDMGRRSKWIYQMVRKRNPLYAKYGICVIYINQLRKKPVRSKFEDPDCLQYDTKIPLVDGRVFSIGEIVEKKIAGDVWSYNEANHTFEAKPISGWVKKDPLVEGEKWLQIITNGPGSKGGKFGLRCTKDHGILTNKGWKNAKNIKVGDEVLSKYDSICNGTLKNFLYGSFIGDSSLRKRKINTGRYQLQDNENIAYLNWKLDKLKGLVNFKKIPNKRGYKYQSEYSIEWAELSNKFTNRNPVQAFDTEGNINPLTLAVWYMDDGHLSHDRQGMICIGKGRTDLSILSELLTNQGYECNPRGRKGILFTKRGLLKLCSDIYKMIPPCMQYKLLPEFRGRYKDFKLYNKPEKKELWVKVEIIEECNSLRVYKRVRNRHKYDLTIEGNHNFIAGSLDNGFIVHNTTPGGNAMKFFAAIRSGIARGKKLEDKDGVHVGQHVYFRIKKNKVAPPKKSVKGRVFFQKTNGVLGYDKYYDILEILQTPNEDKKSVLKRKRGVWAYKGKTIAKGDDKMLELFMGDEDLRKKLIAKSKINTVSQARQKIESFTSNLYPVNGKKKSRE